MIKFFRKIRQNLLSEGKTGKYLKYAIGEIVLVVIGILIALQINNWNEQRAINRNINQYLGAIIQDMKLDIGSLEASRQYHVFRVHSGIYLLNQHDPDFNLSFLPDNNNLPKWEQPSWRWHNPIPTSYNRDFVETSLIWLFRYQPNIPSQKTYNEFSNTGLFSKMDNFELKSRIEQYYGYVNWVHKNFENEFNTNILWNKSLVESGIGYLDLGNMENPINEIFSDKTRIALLQIMIDESIYLSAANEGIVNSLNELINDIETDINTR